MIYNKEVSEYEYTNVNLRYPEYFTHYDTSSSTKDYYYKNNKIKYFEIASFPRAIESQRKSHSINEYPIKDDITWITVEEIFIKGQFNGQGFIDAMVQVDENSDLNEILTEIGIKVVERNSTRQNDKSDKNSGINHSGNYSVPDSWLVRVSNWVSHVLFGF